MPAPAPPIPDTSQLPRALRKHLGPLVEYVKATHVEDAKIEAAPAGSAASPTNPNASLSSIEFLRGDSGLIMKIKVGNDALPGAVTVRCYNFGDLAGGESEVGSVDEISFDSRYFKIHNNGGGECQISLVTTTC